MALGWSKKKARSNKFDRAALDQRWYTYYMQRVIATLLT